MDVLYQEARRKRRLEEENHSNTEALLASAQSLEGLLDGSGTFAAIKDSVEQLSATAPANHDTLIAAFGLIVDEVRFQHPHTIVLCGTDEAGNRSSVVAHFSQLVIRVIYLSRQPESAPREIGFHTLV